jgi:two-component system C4-dicarboxylate transport response regulator DctD
MSEVLKVLIIEDDPDVALGCEQALQLEGIAVECVSSAEQARRRLGRDFRGVVVSDIRLPKMDGMSFLRETLNIDPELPVVLITGHGDILMAVQAMKDGAHDFIQKPFAPEYLVEVVRRALEKRRLVLEVRDLRRQLDQRDLLEGKMIGRAPSMQKIRDMVARLADSAADVLIHGETGTGKELVARCLHEASSRRHGNFVAINCGGLPETLFDSEIFGHEAGAYTGAAKTHR